jgi:UDP-glucose 4-epimerase
MSDICLVTGGAGFIGSHLVEALTASGRRVRVFDDFSTGIKENLAHIHPAPEIVEGDLVDKTEVADAMAGARVAYHLGAIASVQRSIETPDLTHQVCATGTVNVLDAARRNGVRRVVFAASSSAYGNTTGDTALTEETPARPLSPYAAAKLASELYCQAFSHAFGLETVSLRFFNIFGPRQRADSPYSGVIAIFIAAMTRGQAPNVHGDGLQSRDFVYVADAVQALMKAAEVRGVSGRVYNVGTGKSVTVLDLVAALNTALGIALTPQHGPPRAGDVRHSRADITRIRRELGYEPSVSFEEGLERTLAWYRSQAGA